MNQGSAKGSFPVVGIGAPAGGRKTLKILFKDIPSDCGLAFVIAGCREMTAEALQEYTAMPVLAVEDDMKIEQNHVYICPKEKDTGLVHGNFYLREPLPTPRKPLDYFLSALAYDQGENAIGIMLADADGDGAAGLKQIKAQFGLAMAQDGGLAGWADFVLPPEKMGEQILAHSQWLQRKAALHRKDQLVLNPEVLKEVLLMIQMHNGVDFSLYKKGTIYRRIESRMRVCRIQDMDEYVRYLQRSAAEVEALFQAMLINVTRFFRDPEAFAVLENQLLPDLLQNKPEGYNLRVWVPGCSSGEEVYSLAIIIQEALNKSRKNMTLQVFATDIDEDAVLTARAGRYPLSIADDIRPDRLNAYFTLEDNQYRVSKEIRQTVIFASHNLIKDPPFIKLDMICCRNVLIYFESSLQKKLANLFHFSLLPDGILFLGSSESFAGNRNLFAAVNNKWKLYKRRDVESRLWTTSFPAPSIVSAARVRTDLAGVAGPNKQGMINAIEKMLLESYTPACLIVNEKGDVVYTNGRIGKYFELAAGEASLNIDSLVKEEMRYSLRTALRQAAKTKEKGTIRGLRVTINQAPVTLNLEIKPIEKPGTLQGLILVVLHEVAVSATAAGPADGEGGPQYAGLPDSSLPDAGPRIAELEDELQLTKEQLLKTIEEIELSYMETASANEELHSANEELQSSNEEMETSREEMQSLYEEVVTVNNELQNKLNELAHANDDMANLLNSTEIAFIFLDRHLSIMRYTPLAPRLVNIIPTDVGRPLAHLVTKLRGEDVAAEAQRVLETHGRIEKEVETLDGVWYMMRVTPYRTSENIVDGAVVSFVNISKLKALNRLNVELKDSQDYAWSIIQAIGFPLLVLNDDFQVLTANQDFYRAFQTAPAATVGRRLSLTGLDRRHLDNLEEKLSAIVAEGISFRSFVLDHEFPGAENRKICLDAHRIRSKHPSADLILLVFKDIAGN